MNVKIPRFITLLFLSITLSACVETDQEKVDRAIQLMKQQNYTAALPILKPLAEQGNADAQFFLYLMYKEGEHIPRDDKQVAYWLEKLAKNGDAYAQFNLALMYRKGEGVQSDRSKSKMLFKQACDNGLPQGCEAYAERDQQDVR